MTNVVVSKSYRKTFKEWCNRPKNKAVLDSMLESQYGLCNICHKEVVSAKVQFSDNYCDFKTMATVDHILPVKKGGWHTLENLQILCMPCNSRKGAKV